MEKFNLNQNSLEVCQVIIQNHPEITSVKLISHKVGINWRQKYRSKNERIENLTSGLEHSQPSGQRVYSRKEFELLTLKDLPRLPDAEVWSITSRVVCSDGVERHIPIMNFHPANISLTDIKKMVKKITKNSKGAILKSGRFHHYYGDYLLNESEWLKFMANFLMPCILVSPRYIGHRLHDGYCTLRLTIDKKYKLMTPKVVAVF